MNKKGFTLIEVLISLSILTILGGIFFSIANNAIRINSKNDKNIQEMNIAQSVIEDIRDDIKSGKKPYNSGELDDSKYIGIDLNGDLKLNTNNGDMIILDNWNSSGKYTGGLIETTITPQNTSIAQGDSGSSLRGNYKISIENLKREKVRQLYLYTFTVKVKADFSTSKEVDVKTQILEFAK